MFVIFIYVKQHMLISLDNSVVEEVERLRDRIQKILEELKNIGKWWNGNAL